MSHSTSQPGNPPVFKVMTIINYVTGGEQGTLADVDPSCTGVTGFLIGNVPAANNSLGVVLFPVVVAGKIVLLQLVGGILSEIPTTNNLNAVMAFIAQPIF